MERTRYATRVQVILIRHAEAVDETLVLRDPFRPLSVRGRAQARAIGDRLRWHDCVPTHVLASPLVRAVQTAELVVGRFDDDHPVEILPALAPGEPTRDAVAAIRELAKARAGCVIYLIGHEPGLSAIGGVLVGDAEFGALGKAEAARIVDGALRWRFAHDAEAPSR